MLDFRVLGELQVLRDGQPVPLRAGKLRIVLATLLLHAGRTVSIEELIDRLWGETPPAKARTTAQAYVMRLRQALGDDRKRPELIQTRPGGYAITIKPEQLDLEQFRALVAAANGLAAADSVLKLHAALSLWRGPPLDGVPSDSLRRYEVPRLAEERLGALDRRIDLDLELCRHTELVGELLSLTEEAPLREHTWCQLMLALLRGGRQAEALETYQKVRTLLVEELGVEPGTELRRLHEAILRGDPHVRAGDSSRDTSVPRLLPAGISAYVGRQAELARLDGLTDARIVVIHGMAGVGKTALAVYWGHRSADRFPAGQLYVDLHAFDPDRRPMSPGEVLGRFLRALDVESRLIPRDAEERAELFRSVTAEKRLLIVLDNAATAEQVRRLLPGGSAGLVLVTSRAQLTGLVAVDGAYSLPVETLAPEEAITLLESILGKHRMAAELEPAAELAELCGHLPLALRVAAARLTVRHGLEIAAAVTELRAERLTTLGVEDDRQATVLSAFNTSYRGLGAETRRLFRRLGLIPGPDFTLEAAAVLVNQNESSVVRDLGRLVAWHLAESSTPGRYRLHDLLRVYAQDRCDTDESAEANHASLVRLIKWYLALALAGARALHSHHQLLDDASSTDGPFTAKAQAWRWFETERANLTAAVESAAAHGMSSLAWRLVDALRSFFLPRTYYCDTWLAIADIGLRAADQTGDHRAQAALHLSLGLAHWGLGRNQEYLEHSTKALLAARRVGWTKVAAKALTNLGHAHLELGHPRRALECLVESIALKRSTGPRADLAFSLIIQANAHGILGDLPDSLTCLHEALALARRDGSIPEQTHALYGLGQSYRHLGEFSVASNYLVTGLASAREQDNKDREATALGALAEIACASGQAAKARDLIQQALTIAGTSGYRQTQTKVLNAAGRVSCELGRPDTATTRHQRALDIARETACHYDATDALLGLAEAHQSLGNHHQAHAIAQEALSQSTQAGYRRLADSARTLLSGIKHEG